MTQPKRIRTPLRVHLRQIRHQLLPAIILVGAVLGTGWLWQHNPQLPQLVGEVQVTSIPVRAPCAGILTALSSGSPQLFDQVQQGQCIAQLDDEPRLAGLTALREEVSRQEKELESVAAKIRQEETDREYNWLTEWRRLGVDLETYRLKILSLQTQIESEQVRLARAEMFLHSTEKLRQAGAATTFEVEDLQLRCDQSNQIIEGAKREMAQAQLDLKSAETRQSDFPSTQPSELEAFLDPIRKARSAAEARAHELELQIACGAIKAPASGKICAILHRPGQVVQAGDEILSITADCTPTIVAYIRDRQPTQPKVGATMLLQTRPPAGQPVPATVLQLGPAVQEIPAHQRLDPTRPEWGRPILIAVPHGMNLVPGQLVDITAMQG